MPTRITAALSKGFARAALARSARLRAPRRPIKPPSESISSDASSSSYVSLNSASSSSSSLSDSPPRVTKARSTRQPSKSATTTSASKPAVTARPRKRALTARPVAGHVSKLSPVAALQLRTRRLSDAPIRDGKYVLCWLGQALRAEDNAVIEAALVLGAEQKLPVVVLHTLENRYPYASHRQHRFILEASAELKAGVEARGLRFVRYIRQGPMAGDAPGAFDIAARVGKDAAAVFTNDVPTFVALEYAQRVVAALPNCAVFAVDACCAVPMNAFTKHLTTTPEFRAAHTALRGDHLTLDLTQPSTGCFEGELDVPSCPEVEKMDDAALDALIGECGVDMSIPPAPWWRGRRSDALARLQVSVEKIIPRYKWTRNNPADENATTKLSPWIHYGVLGPREICAAVLAGEDRGVVHPAARWKFLDELLTWREFYYHRCRFEPDFMRYRGLAAASRKSMDSHADDPRPRLFSLDALVHGETDDETWNAAQKQFLLDGWMNNNLRMYWSRQLLKWRPSPSDAFAVTCYLNDRLSLDGRDAATYGGIRSGFGEVRHYRDRPIYGTIAGKTDAALRKRPKVPEWLAAQAARPVTWRVSIPSDPAPEFDRYI